MDTLKIQTDLSGMRALIYNHDHSIYAIIDDLRFLLELRDIGVIIGPMQKVYVRGAVDDEGILTIEEGSVTTEGDF